MIDPRFAHTGGVPFPGGFGVQPVSFQQHRHHHHQHRHRKVNKSGVGETPVSRDESIHKVDHNRQQYQQNDNVPFGASGGYGVPYGAGGFYVQQQQQQQPFAGANYGFNSQYQGNVYDQGHFHAPVHKEKHRRRHHRHHHHAAEATSGTGAGEQAQEGVPEQLIGQRSSSVLGNEAPQAGSSSAPPQDQARADQSTHRRHRHRRHKQNGNSASFGHAYQGHSSAGADGYGHINDDLIFIERGDHSPHRQEPPAGYEYKGKIEVQSVDRERRSRSQGHSATIQPSVPFVQPSVPLVQPSVPIAQPTGPCPPGWQQMILTAAPGGPCPPGGALYSGQLAGPAGVAQAGLGGIGGFGGAAGGIGFGGVGPIGAAGSGGGLDSLAASLPFPPQGQLVADYIVEGSASNVGSTTEYPQVTSAGHGEHHHAEQIEGNVSSRATVIEVWQKRGKSEVPGRSRSRSRTRSPRPGQPFDFDRFRRDILGAIERMGGSGGKIQWTGHDGGTQTQIHQGVAYDHKRDVDRKTAGEVRVIVQPIQPVFYMPQQTAKTASVTNLATGPAIQQAPGAASNVIYVPRNVYVPVIKPVFVPRERVIVRPQVVHVARPVLVDRPVPVTQRPIIIDRERPVPVPVRGGGGGNQTAAQATSSRSTKEDYVYQDNLPVAYGNNFTETTSGANYDYVPPPQEQQYTTTSTHEIASSYQTQGPTINIPVPEQQFQHSHSGSHLNVDQGASTYHESYSNIARTSSASGIDVTPLHCAPPIEVLDAAVNPSWQRTDQSNLVRLYGRPAYEIVQRSDQIEQQMYQELRHRNGSGGVQRSESAASYGSGAGLAGHHGGYGTHTGSYSTTHVSHTQNVTSEVYSHQEQGSDPVCINY